MFENILQLVFGPLVHISAGLRLVFQGLQAALPGWKYRDFGLVELFFVNLGRFFHQHVGHKRFPNAGLDLHSRFKRSLSGNTKRFEQELLGQISVIGVDYLAVLDFVFEEGLGLVREGHVDLFSGLLGFEGGTTTGSLIGFGALHVRILLDRVDR